MKTLACEDLVPGCLAVVEAETEEEILQIAARHATAEHGMEVTPELVVKVKAAIREGD
jgi:predicted small metal-binding protein